MGGGRINGMVGIEGGGGISSDSAGPSGAFIVSCSF